MDNLHDSTIPTQAVTLLRTWTRAHRRVGVVVLKKRARSLRGDCVPLHQALRQYLERRGWDDLHDQEAA